MAEYSVSHETDFWEHWWWGLGCCHKWWLNPPACTHPNSWRCHDTEVSAETLESREFPTRDKILYSTCYPQIYCIATVGALQSRIGNEVTGINVCPARLPTELNMSSFSGIMLPSCKLISTQTWMTEQQDLIWFQKRLLWLWVNTNVTISIIFSRTLNTNLCLSFSFQFFFSGFDLSPGFTHFQETRPAAVWLGHASVLGIYAPRCEIPRSVAPWNHGICGWNLWL